MQAVRASLAESRNLILCESIGLVRHVAQRGSGEMQETQRAYLPAAGHDWALAFYDPLVKVLGGDAARTELLDQAGLGTTDRVLDIGCGTGTFVAQIKRLYPCADVVGLDPDPKALARARKKVAGTGMPVRLDQGFSDELPYPDASFDRVFSSLMFHHIEADDRGKTLCEVRRVLKRGGSFHLLDFTAEHGHGARGRWFHSHARVRDNSEDRILALMAQAGFAHATKVADRTMLFGLLPIAYYRASPNLQQDLCRG